MTAFCVSSSAAGLSCTGLKCQAYYEFNTAKRSFINVCLLIVLFSILVFSLNKIEALQTMKRCTAKGCYAVVNFSFVMF